MAQYRDIDLPTGVKLRINGDLLIPSSFNLLVGGNITAESGGFVSVVNPNNVSANVALSWLNDKPRIRIGGTGSGNASAFEIQGTGDTLRFSVADNGFGIFAGAVQLGAQASASNHAVRADRTITAGSGLSGGGDLTANRTIAVSFAGNGVATTSARSDHDHDANYLGISAVAVDSDKLDGLDSAAFLRTDIVSTGNAEVSFKNGIRLIPPTVTSVPTSGSIFTGNTAKSYINFNAIAGNSDPAQIYHETGAATGDANRGVIHLCPSDDNGTTDDYVAIHGTNDPETIRIYTGGKITTPSDISASGGFFVGANAVWHSGNFVPSQYVKNDTTGQSVNGNFNINGDGNIWVGATTGTRGNVMVRSGNTVQIQLDTSGTNKQTGVKSYIDGSGNAQFSGNVLINTLSVVNTGMVTGLNTQYLNGLEEYEFVKNIANKEIGGYGVYTGLAVSQQTVPNMTVLVGSGTAYTNSGRRSSISQQSVSLAASSATYDRIDVIYVQGSAGGANEGSITVAAGTPASSPVEPSIPAGSVKLATVRVKQNIGSILNADITDARVWRPLRFIEGTWSFILKGDLSLDTGTEITSQTGTVDIGKPIKGTSFAKTLTIPAGSTSVTWTHNLALGTSYIITWSTDSPNRHVYWSSKATNSIVINIDDVNDTAVNVDALIVAI